jgi:hypothetical protein
MRSRPFLMYLRRLLPTGPKNFLRTENLTHFHVYGKRMPNPPLRCLCPKDTTRIQ